MIKREIHIYLLDDDADQLDIIVREFEGLLKVLPGAVLKTYTSAKAFFADFNTNVYTAIIDHRLEGQSGFDVVRRINEHNQQNPSAPCTIIVMSGSKDPKICARYMNTRTARFYAAKDEEDFYEQLATFTKIAFNESLNEREKADWTEAYAKRLEKRQNFVDSKFLSLMEGQKDGTD